MSLFRCKVSLFVSGSGSNLQSIIDSAIEGLIIAPVVCDNPDAYAIQRARKSNLPLEIVDYSRFDSKKSFESEIIDRLEKYKPDLIALAGFMKILSPFFISRFKNRIMNIHPSLLPSFPGTSSVKQAIDYGVKYTGCTVHFVDEGVYTGPVILQSAIAVEPEDNQQTLLEKIHSEEYRIYPEAIRLFSEGRIQMKGRKVFIRNKRKD